MKPNVKHAIEQELERRRISLRRGERLPVSARWLRLCYASAAKLLDGGSR